MRNALCPSPSPPFLFLPFEQWLRLKPTLTSSIPVVPLSSTRRFYAKNRRWDSNAETFRTRNFNFNAKEDDDEEENGEQEQWFDVLEEFIDGVWIFRTFRSFGWMLPALLASTLLATGPKAFLMALAIPMGQSALTLAFRKVQEMTQDKPRRKRRKTKKGQRNTTTSNFDIDQELRRQRMEYKAWMTGKDVPRNEDMSFGGWEELDREAQYDTRSTGMSAPKSKLTRSETPLLLRLLVAVFPFLASWTKML